MAVDMTVLARMSPDEALAYLRDAYAGGIGPISATGGTTEVDPVYYQSKDFAPGAGIRGAEDGRYVAPLTNTFDPEYEGGVYGNYEGVFDADGNLVDVKFRKQERSDGFFMDNLETIGPLVVLGAMGAGGGLFSGLGGAGAATGDAALIGGTAADTLGAGGLLATEGSALGSGITAGGGSSIGGGALGSGLVPGVASGSGIGGGALGSGLTAGGMTAGQLAAMAGGGGSTLGSIVNALGGAKNVAGLAGALIGAATSGNKTSTSTSQREPWGPAQDWIKDNIQKGQALQERYAESPFNDVQKQAYQNVFSGIDNYRSNILPNIFSGINSWRPYSRTGTQSAPMYNFQVPQATPYGQINWQGLLGGSNGTS